MPHTQAMLERANAMFNRQTIGTVNPELLAPGESLPHAARELGIAESSFQEALLAAWPAGQLEALRSALLSAVERSLPVTFAWAPGYDYELRIWEAPGLPDSIGGMTVLLRTRYPNDTHPATIGN